MPRDNQATGRPQHWWRYLAGNSCIAAIVALATALLIRTESFCELTLETIASQIQKTTWAAWIERFVDRYLRFDKVDAALNDEAGSR